MYDRAAVSELHRADDTPVVSRLSSFQSKSQSLHWAAPINEAFSGCQKHSHTLTNTISLTHILYRCKTVRQKCSCFSAVHGTMGRKYELCKEVRISSYACGQLRLPKKAKVHKDRVQFHTAVLLHQRGRIIRRWAGRAGRPAPTALQQTVVGAGYRPPDDRTTIQNTKRKHKENEEKKIGGKTLDTAIFILCSCSKSPDLWKN